MNKTLSHLCFPAALWAILTTGADALTLTPIKLASPTLAISKIDTTFTPIPIAIGPFEDVIQEPGSGSLPAVLSPTRRQWDQVASRAGLLRRVTADVVGLEIKTAFGYDAHGNGVEVVDPEGLLTRMRFDSWDRPVSLTGPLGDVAQASYDASSRPVQTLSDDRELVSSRAIRNPPVSAQQHHDVDGLTIEKGLGGVGGTWKALYYDRDRRFKSAAGEDGRGVRCWFDEADRIVRQCRGVINEAGELAVAQEQATRFEYENGLLLREILPGGATIRYEYDEWLRVSRKIMPHGISFRMAYDQQDRPTRRMTEDEDGRILEQTQWEYDCMGRVRLMTLDVRNDWGQLINTETFEHVYRDALREQETIRTVNGATLRVLTRYDALQRPVEVRQDNLASRFFAYDPAGRVVRTWDTATGQTNWFTYGADGLQALSNAVACTQFRHSTQGRITRSRGPLGDVLQFPTDSAGRSLGVLGENMIRLSDGQPAQTRMEYDEIGRAIGVVDANGLRIEEYRYHENEQSRLHGRMTYRIRSGNQWRMFSDYDPRTGRLRWERDESGNWIGYEYDQYGRMSSLLAFGADGTQHRRDLGYTALGQLAFMRQADNTATSEVRYAYDSKGRILTETIMLNGESMTVSNEYSGRLGSMGRQVYPSGFEANFEYTTGNRLRRVSASRPGLNATLGMSFSYRADRPALLSSMQAGNKVTRRFTYDPAGKVGAVADTRETLVYTGWRYVTQFTPLRDEEMRHDKAGRVIATRTRFGAGANPLLPDETWGYNYDRRGNLIQRLRIDEFETVADYVDDAVLLALGGVRQCVPQYAPVQRAVLAEGQEAASNWAYDAGGNRIWSASSNQLALCEHTDNRLTRMTVHKGCALIDGQPWRVRPDYSMQNRRYEYDANGNLVGGMTDTGSYTLTWNPWGQLVRYQNLTRDIRFTYDAIGRRIRKTVYAVHDGRRQLLVDTRFMWSGMNMIESRSDSGAVTSYAYAGGLDALIGWVDPTRGARYLHKDTSGNAAMITDAAGQVVEYMRVNDSLGILSVLDAEGGPLDRSQSPFLFAGQQFDRETGWYYMRQRYYAPDIGRFISPDPIGIAGGLNLYAYASDPINQSDPLGLSPRAIAGFGRSEMKYTTDYAYNSWGWGNAWSETWQDIMDIPVLGSGLKGLGVAMTVSSPLILSTQAGGWLLDELYLDPSHSWQPSVGEQNFQGWWNFGEQIVGTAGGLAGARTVAAGIQDQLAMLTRKLQNPTLVVRPSARAPTHILNRYVQSVSDRVSRMISRHRFRLALGRFTNESSFWRSLVDRGHGARLHLGGKSYLDKAPNDLSHDTRALTGQFVGELNDYIVQPRSSRYRGLSVEERVVIRTRELMADPAIARIDMDLTGLRTASPDLGGAAQMNGCFAWHEANGVLMEPAIAAKTSFYLGGVPMPKPLGMFLLKLWITP